MTPTAPTPTAPTPPPPPDRAARCGGRAGVAAAAAAVRRRPGLAVGGRPSAAGVGPALGVVGAGAHPPQRGGAAHLGAGDHRRAAAGRDRGTDQRRGADLDAGGGGRDGRRGRGRPVRVGPAPAAGGRRPGGEHHHHRPRPGHPRADRRAPRARPGRGGQRRRADRLPGLPGLAQRGQRPPLLPGPTPAAPAPGRRRPTGRRSLGDAAPVGGDPPAPPAQGHPGRPGRSWDADPGRGVVPGGRGQGPQVDRRDRRPGRGQDHAGAGVVRADPHPRGDRHLRDRVRAAPARAARAAPDRVRLGGPAGVRGARPGRAAGR